MADKKEMKVVDFKTLPVDFNSTDVDVTGEALAILKEKYSKVPNCSTKDGYALAKEGESLLRSLRVKVEAKRKELKSEALSYGKKVDAEALRITELVSALEGPLKKARKAEDEVKAEEKRLAAIKEQERVAAIEKDINTIRNVVLDCHGKTSLELSGIIESLDATPIEMERFAEHTPIAEAAKLEAVQKLEELRDQALVTEKADEERIAEDARLAELSKKLDDEKLENERISTIKDKVQSIKDRGAYDPEATADQILGRIHILENTRASKEVFEEFTEEAHMAIGIALGALKDFHVFAADKERLAAVAAEEALKAEEETAENIVGEAIEDTASDSADEIIEAAQDGGVVDAEFFPGDQVDTVKTSEDIELAERMAFVDALVKLFPVVPTLIANNIYWAMQDGKIPFKFMGDE